jgi:hypothetical protein
MNRRSLTPLARVGTLVALVTTASSAISSCKVTRTEIVLRVDTDIPQGPGMTLTSVRVAVRRGDAPPTFRKAFVLDGSENGPFLPADMGIVPFEGDVSRPITVSVTAVQGTTELFTHESIVTFERERTTRLDVFLADRCRDANNRMCPAGTTCGPMGCEAQRRTTLPAFDGADASVSRPDVTATDTSALPDTSQGEDVTVPPEMDSAVTMDASPPEMDASADTGVSMMDVAPPRDTSALPDVTPPRDTMVVPVGSCGPVPSGPRGTLAALVLSSGTSTLDTGTGALTGAGGPLMLSGTIVVQGRAGYPRIAVYDFASITIAAGATLRITGPHAVALLSAGSAEIAGTIDLAGGQGTSGSVNTAGPGGAAGAGGFSGGAISGGCASGTGGGQGPGPGNAGSCGGTGGRGMDGAATGGGGGGGGSGCGGGGGAGGTHVVAGNDGAMGAAGTNTTGSVGAGTGGGTGGMSCTGSTPGGTPNGFVFDSSLNPIAGGSGGGGGGFGGFQGFGGRGGGSNGGAGGSGGFSGGGGGGGGGGGAIVLCAAGGVTLAGQIRANGGLGGVGSGAGTAAMGTSGGVTSMTAAGGGGGAGASGAGGGGGGGAGGAVYVQAPSVDFSGTLNTNGGLGGAGFSVGTGGGPGGLGRAGGGSGGMGARGGTGGGGGDGSRGAIRVVSPMFNNRGIVNGMLRHDPM